MLIPHTPLIQGEKKNQQLDRAELVFTSFHGHKGLILRALESPVAVVVGLPGTVSFPPQHTQSTLTAAL